MYKRLFIPGPVDVREDVLQRLSMPQISHRGAEATQLQKSISEKLQKLMFTQNHIILSTSSGSGLMEMAVRCLSNKKVAVFSTGAFGDKWYKMCTANGKAADKIKSEAGQPTTAQMVEDALKTGEYDLITITHNETSMGLTNDLQELSKVYKKYPDVLVAVDTVSSLGGVKIPVDEWGIDMCVASTQKCLGLPAGFSVASVSQRAYERAKSVPNRGLYFDLVSVLDNVLKNYQYPNTPSLPHMFALDYQLDYILNVEGLENRFARHRQMAEVVRAWAKKHFEIFPAESHASDTVTCIKNTKGISIAQLNKDLAPKGFLISNGYGDFKEVTFRIAHMADTKPEVLQELLDTIDEILK